MYRDKDHDNDNDNDHVNVTNNELIVVVVVPKSQNRPLLVKYHVWTPGERAVPAIVYLGRSV